MNTAHSRLPPYIPPPRTTHELDYAELAIIDLSTFDRSAEDRIQLARHLDHAIRYVGFWTVTGHGISDEEVNHQLSIGQAFFKQPTEEKRQYPCDFAHGSYIGYREPVRKIADTDVKENHEMLNIAKFNEQGCRHPLHNYILPHATDIASFQKKLWESVLKKLLVLIEIVLELPENYLVQRHEYARASEDYLSYKIYHPRTHEQWEAIDGKFRPGHTDFGCLTLVCTQTQTVSGLTIRTSEGNWKHVRPVPGGITVNAGDTLSIMTNGYIKSTVHAVCRPPPDQQHLDRIALLYFLRLVDDAEVAVVPSPALERLGFKSAAAQRKQTNNVVQAHEWTSARIKAYNHRATIESVNEPNYFEFRGLRAQVRYD